MKPITAKITKGKAGELYLTIENPNDGEPVMVALLEEEVEPVKKACEEYLKGGNDDLL